ncbi:MAG: hypothetical protein WBF53_03580, partial [Litorimonas sp.]
MTLRLQASIVRRPLVRPFVISTGARSHQPVLSVRLSEGALTGRGEGRDLPYLGDTPEAQLALLERVRPDVEAGITREGLLNLLPPGGARAALDAALWD